MKWLICWWRGEHVVDVRGELGCVERYCTRCGRALEWCNLFGEDAGVWRKS